MDSPVLDNPVVWVWWAIPHHQHSMVERVGAATIIWVDTTWVELEFISGRVYCHANWPDICHCFVQIVLITSRDICVATASEHWRTLVWLACPHLWVWVVCRCEWWAHACVGGVGVWDSGQMSQIIRTSNKLGVLMLTETLLGMLIRVGHCSTLKRHQITNTVKHYSIQMAKSRTNCQLFYVHDQDYWCIDAIWNVCSYWALT